MTDGVVTRFAELFCGRRDRYGVLYDAQRGLYRSEATALTETQYRLHLEGRLSLGVYPMVPGDLTHWLVIDLDDPSETVLRALAASLAALGFVPYAERSKRKGWHLWCFLDDWYPAYQARALARRALRATGLPVDTEVFPKQDRLLPGTVGNFVNLPYHGALSEQPPDRRVMVDLADAALRPVPLADFLATVRQTPLPSPQAAHDMDSSTSHHVRIISTFGDRVADLPEGFTPNCIAEAEQTDLLRCFGPNRTLYRNEALCRIATWYLSRGEDVDAVIERARAWNARQSAPLDDRELVRTVQGLAARGYNPYGCAKIRLHPVFDAACVRELCPLYDATQDQSADVVADEPELLERIQAQPLSIAVNPLDALLRDFGPLTEAEVTDLLSVGWIGDYVAFMRTRSRAPRVFHAFMALGILAGAMGNRFAPEVYSVNFSRMSLFVVLYGRGSVGKSTALESANHLLSRIMPDHVVNDLSSGPALYRMLQRADSHVVFVCDEIGEQIKRWFKSSLKMSQKTIYGWLLEWHDGRERSNRQLGTKDEETNRYNELVGRPAVTILSTLNMASLKGRVFETEDFFNGGFFSRLLFVRGEQQEPSVLFGRMPSDDEFEVLESPIRELRRFGASGAPPNPPIMVQPEESDAEARATINQWEARFARIGAFYKALDEEGLANSVGRCPDFLRRFAALLAVSEQYCLIDRVRVEARHLDTAGRILLWLMDNARDVYGEVFRKTDFEVRASAVRRYLTAQAGGAPLADVLAYLGESRRVFRELIDTLKDRGELIEVDVRSGGAGRPKRYLWLTEAFRARSQDGDRAPQTTLQADVEKERV